MGLKRFYFKTRTEVDTINCSLRFMPCSNNLGLILFVTFWKLIHSHAVTPRWLDGAKEFIQSGWSKQRDSCSLAHEILAADAGRFESRISQKLFGG